MTKMTDTKATTLRELTLEDRETTCGGAGRYRPPRMPSSFITDRSDNSDGAPPGLQVAPAQTNVLILAP